jgi:diacylglycerol kinase family enzyme
MNGRAFLLMGGTGFDAWVLRELLHHRRGKIGFGDYARGALRGLRRYPFPDLKVSSSGSESRGHTAIVGRAPLYGGFLRPTPRADLARDRFEVCTISEGVGTLIRTVAAMWSGDHLRCPGIDMSFHRSLLVESLGAKIPIQIDGELAGELPARFEISSRELQLVV